VKLALGLRNSHDKSFSLAVCSAAWGQAFVFLLARN
jgi:hypothetical protein